MCNWHRVTASQGSVVAAHMASYRDRPWLTDQPEACAKAVAACVWQAEYCKVGRLDHMHLSSSFFVFTQTICERSKQFPGLYLDTTASPKRCLGCFVPCQCCGLSPLNRWVFMDNIKHTQTC